MKMTPVIPVKKTATKLNTWPGLHTFGDKVDNTSKACSYRLSLKRQNESNRKHGNEKCTFDYLGVIFLFQKLDKHNDPFGRFKVAMHVSAVARNVLTFSINMWIVKSQFL